MYTDCSFALFGKSEFIIGLANMACSGRPCLATFEPGAESYTMLTAEALVAAPKYKLGNV